MNVMMENIITGIVKPISGLAGKEQRIDESGVQRNESTGSVRHREGELPVGLGVVPIIPTGSIFVPRELIMPKEEEPLDVEVIISDKQELIPQKIEENTTKVQKTDKPDTEQKAEINPAVVRGNTHTIDILI